MSTAINVYCLVHGDNLHCIFPVEIAATKTVGALKDTIKDKKRPAFDHIPADALTLWKVSFNFDVDLERNIAKFDLDDGGQLSPWLKLSSVFSDRPTDCLDIIIGSPPTLMDSKLLQLNCLVLGDDPGHLFPVEIATTKTVGALREAIKDKKKHAFQQIDADALILWQVSIPVGEILMESLGKLDLVDASALSPAQVLSRVFSNVPDVEHLHIVIHAPRSESAAIILDDSPLHRSQSAPPDEVNKLIEKFTTKCRPRMKELVAHADDIERILPSWQPKKFPDHHWRQFVSRLRIPSILGANQPSLLLHNLGEEMDNNRATRISDIFRGSEHRILINTSGSGKTRLLLEGLCRQWGFYFTAEKDSSATGSSDFSMILNGFNEHHDYKRARMMNEGNKKTPGSVAIARRGLCQLLLARFLLLRLLVQEVRTVKGPLSWAKYRRLWVLLQAQPEQVFGPVIDFNFDVFTDLALLLRCARLGDLEERIRATYRELHSLGPFFCVLDEAQVTTNVNYLNFFSADNTSPRPVLREIWLSWTSVLSIFKMCVIISGTGIELDEITQTLASPAAKQANYQIINEIGAFDDPDDQATYIKQYIPADWTDRRWKNFLKRAWAWFRGRYRFTATLVSLILQVGSLSPHSTINLYVEAFTGFKPTDGDDLTKQEPLLLPLPKISRLYLDKMNYMQARTLSEVIFKQILYGCYSLRSFTMAHRAKFVEYGFARHKPGVTNPVIDEPLAIMAALTWLNKNAHLSLIECLRHDIGKHAKSGNGFEAYFAFYIRKVFETPKKLDEVFTFRSDFVKRADVAWQREDFELVTVVGADGDQPMVSVVRPYHGPSSNIGFRATLGEEVLSWISNNHDQFTFCFPPEPFGPDILFFVQSVVSKKLLLVAAQCKNYLQVERKDLLVGVRTITPSWFWKSKNYKHQSVQAAPFVQNGPRNSAQLAVQTKETLGNIPLGLTVSGADFPVLRVFASWEGDAKLERSLRPLDKKTSQSTSKTQARDENDKTTIYDIDLHPVAALHLDNFNYVSKQMDIHWFQGNVEQREVVHLKRSVHSTGSDNPHGIKRVRLKPDDQMEGLDVN